MEVTNVDIKTINAIATAQRVDEINAAAQRTIYQVPGISPLAPPKERKRSKYNDVLLKEAVDLAEIVGVAAASRRLGVEPSSIYKFAAGQGKTISKRKGRETIIPRRKYAASALREAFQRGLQWHQNTGVGIRLCIERAAKASRINENYLWALYCSKDPVLGFGGGS